MRQPNWSLNVIYVTGPPQEKDTQPQASSTAGLSYWPAEQDTHSAQHGERGDNWAGGL